MSQFIDLTGKQFDRWRVLRQDGRIGQNQSIAWLCECLCGVQRPVRGADLTYGKSTSCGCKKLEIVLERNFKHGHGCRQTSSRPPSYSVWKGIRKRCLNPNHKNYADYGGRGIKVCDRWSDFSCFYADMGDPPTDKHTLDRYPNNNGNYEPGNCRWALIKEQQRNKRSNRMLEFRGETRRLAEWVEVLDLKNRLGVSYATASCRLSRGWSVKATFTTPKIVREVKASA